MRHYGCAIQPPKSPIRPMLRPALLALYDDVSSSRITLVHGAAGYGKTSVLLEWRRLCDEAGRTSIWLSPRSGIASRYGMFGAIGEALGVEDAGDGAASLERIVEIAGDRQVGRAIVFIDDAHLLTPEAREAVLALSDRARDMLSIVLAARGARILPVARLRAHRLLLTVGPDQLRLSTREGLAFLARDLGRPIEITRGTRLVTAADGWIAGLAMLSQAIADGIPDPLDGTLDRDFAEYFTQEVLWGLSPARVCALTDMAVLDTFAKEECNRLDSVVGEDLFVSCSGIHPLFRRMLLARLAADPARLRMLHEQASRRFSEEGNAVAAVQHARAASEPEFLATMLERHAEALVYASHMDLVVELADTLPWAIVSRFPAVLLTMAWRKARGMAFATAERLIAAAESAIDLLALDMDDPEAIALRQRVRHRRIVLAASRDDLAFVERESGELLIEIGDDSAYLTCNLLAMKMIARREFYHFQDAMRLEADTRIALRQPGADFASIAFKASIAPNLIAQGKVDTAETLLVEALDTAIQFSGRDTGLAALPALPLAELAYERGDLDRARTLYTDHIGQVRIWGFADQILSGHLVGARLALADVDPARAIALLNEAHLVALECGVERMVACVVAEQVRCLLIDGQVAAAERLFADTGLDTDDVLPGRNASRPDELRAVTWVRLEIRRGHLSAARKTARAWRDFLSRHGAVRSTIGFDLLLVQIAFLEGDGCEARRVLRGTIALAAPGGFARVFVDEGEIIASLIRDSYRDDLRFGGPTDAFAMRLLDMVSPRAAIVALEAEAATAEQLARRECEILSLVDAGLRNGEIGARLGLTEGTVKWYMQQIYDKLGVRRRPQAVIRARQLGMLR